MPKSLFDDLDLARVRLAATGSRRRGVAAVACLLEGGVLQHDPLEPFWDDRDRVIVGGDALVPAVADGFAAAGYPPDTGWTYMPPDQALAVGFGAAAASRMDGGIYRVWCLLDAAACARGGVWEVALAAAAAGEDQLIAIVDVDGRQGQPDLWRAAGWAVWSARADDVVGIIGALDQAVAGHGHPSAVLVVAAR